MLATTASEKGAETTIKIWSADVVPSQSIGKSEIHPVFPALSHAIIVKVAQTRSP